MRDQRSLFERINVERRGYAKHIIAISVRNYTIPQNEPRVPFESSV